MKITVNVDMTPQELRAFLGLPNVEPLQEEMVQKLREHMEMGEGVDPVSLMRPFLAPNFQNLEAMQKAFWHAFYGQGTKAAERDEPGEGPETKGD